MPATTEGIKDNFFEYLSTPRCSTCRRRLTTRRSGPGWPASASGPGRTFEFKDLSLEHKAAVLLGMKAGDEQGRQVPPERHEDINGWNVGAFFGDQAFYKGDWLMRAGAAKGGLYGNDAVEAMYPYTRVDGDGETLDASKHNYTITFPAGRAAAGQRLLVGDDVRRQEPAADQEPDQPLPDQLADAARR